MGLGRRYIKLLTPKQYTLWTPHATDGAIQISSSVHTRGYSTKSIMFQSNAAGDLDIQVYVGGGWRSYDKFIATPNKLEVRTITAEVPLVRLEYTPSDSDTITYAEAFLS